MNVLLNHLSIHLKIVTSFILLPPHSMAKPIESDGVTQIKEMRHGLWTKEKAKASSKECTSSGNKFTATAVSRTGHSFKKSRAIHNLCSL